MEASGADRPEMDVDVPTGNQSNQQANTRTLRNAVFQGVDERDGRSTSVSSSTSASRSRSERTIPRVNYVLINRSPPPTASRKVRHQGESSGQHPSNQARREEDIASRGVQDRVSNLLVGQANAIPAVQTDIPPTVQTNLQSVTQVNNPQAMQMNAPPAAQHTQVTPIDLTVRERLQELERENKRLKVALEKRKEVEEAVIPRSGGERSYHHRDPDSPCRWNDHRRRSRSNKRREDNGRDVYQSRNHHNDIYYDRYITNNDHYYAAERGRHDDTSRVKHRQRMDHKRSSLKED
ncbi:uncharacterized protein LOC113358320 [Papaver somniferum]|uniref:uncharacterized protein LOC113358320 n=1 Tax=Papaver somniferum TaxID=3469 RepID=UPI000E6FD87C|nr:uncharacterized protein LOC113358320 [Papaver somniferum]